MRQAGSPAPRHTVNSRTPPYSPCTATRAASSAALSYELLSYAACGTIRTVGVCGSGVRVTCGGGHSGGGGGQALEGWERTTRSVEPMGAESSVGRFLLGGLGRGRRGRDGLLATGCAECPCSGAH